MKQPKVFVFTRAYNAEATISRTIESVLNQTYSNISYVIRDNGSTDRTYAICQKYAEKDSRIILVRNEKNNLYESQQDQQALDTEKSVRYGFGLNEGDFSCLLDADDEYMPHFFERAVQLAQEKQLDIVAGGSQFIQEGTGAILGGVIHPADTVIVGQGFSKLFPQYHWNTRQVWGKLFRRNTVLGLLDYWLGFRETVLNGGELPYGADTINVLYSFQKANRVGILSGCQHRYYIQNKSVSSVLQPNRVESDQILHNATIEFLNVKCGFVSLQNQEILHKVYANAVMDTLRVVNGAKLSPVQKIHEYRKIAEYSVTRALYGQKEECASRCINMLRNAVIQAGLSLSKNEDSEDLSATAQAVFPRCGAVFTAENAPLFSRDAELLRSLLRDDWDALMKRLFQLVIEKRYVKQFDLGAIIARLIPTKTPLYGVTEDTRFFRKYASGCLLILEENHVAALDQMTGLLLEETKQLYGKETFLHLYLTLAALENQPVAFLFGKIQLAYLCLNQGRTEDCRAVVAELEEMGAGEHEEVVVLRENLEIKTLCDIKNPHHDG